MSARGPRGAAGGFTLVELLVGMAILVTIMGSTLLIFRGATRAWRTGELRTERYQQARLLFDLFSRELASSVAHARYPFIGLKASDPSPLHEGPAAGGELLFVGTLPGRSGFIERGYWLNDRGDLLCHDDDSGDGDYRTGASELCGRDVSELAFTFFDGTRWLDRWDAQPAGPQAGLLPKAVHITLRVGQGSPEPFETVIYVPTS